MRKTQVWSLGWEDPLEKEMATHSSTLAWKIPWMEERGRVQSIGSQRVRHNWVTSLSLFHFLQHYIDYNEGPMHPHLQACLVPGASPRDPTHNKVMRRRPDKQGRSGLQGFWKAAPALTLKITSVFLMLAILDYSLISVTRVDGPPRSLSKQNQPRTLINMSPRWRYPIRLSRMKGVFQFRPLCWHLACLANAY